MSYKIKCNDCGETTNGGNIVTLLNKHRHPDWLFKCGKCNVGKGCIKKTLNEQEGTKITVYLVGILKVGGHGNFQPYAFLCAKSCTAEPHAVLFGYYKDLRTKGGKLKHGHGPGGAPMISFASLKRLVDEIS
ncbi:hypothetical protein [Candidatus Spongiihabitans sp.]|uniref:hypothetical protein n=1 Tax=Candidatus Spongiihabitans sp. TaxID=3101308 RepID=UPI003C6EFDD9